MRAPWSEHSNPKSGSRPPVAAITFFGLVGLLILFIALQSPRHGLKPQSRQGRLSLAEQALQYGDDHEAASLFGRLAKTGNAAAEYWLAQMTENGRGVSRNPGKAIKLYAKSAKQNFTKAEVRLGEIYLDGNLVPPSPKRARGYLKDAAYGGNAHAATLLGEIYRDGIGVPANSSTADAWFEVANLEGSAFARRERGTSFRELSAADKQGVITRTQKILKTIKRTAAGRPVDNPNKSSKSATLAQSGLAHMS